MEYAGLIAVIGAVAAGLGALLGVFGKQLMEYLQKRSDISVAELKAKTEREKTERDQVFDETLKLVHILQEREKTDEEEKERLRKEAYELRHMLSDCRDKLRKEGAT